MLSSACADRCPPRLAGQGMLEHKPDTTKTASSASPCSSRQRVSREPYGKDGVAIVSRSIEHSARFCDEMASGVFSCHVSIQPKTPHADVQASRTTPCIKSISGRNTESSALGLLGQAPTQGARLPDIHSHAHACDTRAGCMIQEQDACDTRACDTRAGLLPFFPHSSR